MESKRYWIDIWEWEGVETPIEILAIEGSTLKALRRETARGPVPFPCEGFELERRHPLPVLKWTGEGSPPKIKVEVEISRGEGESAKDSKGRAALLGALAPYVLGLAAAVLGIVATNLRYDLEAYNTIVDGRFKKECEAQPSKPICLTKQLASLDDVREKCKSSNSSRLIVEGKLLEEQQDVKRYVDPVASVCPVDDTLLCLKFVADTFPKLVRHGGCNLDDKKQLQSCVGRLSATADSNKGHSIVH